MNRFIIILLLILSPSIIVTVNGQIYSISGKVIDSKTKKPVEYATIAISENGLWAISSESGSFKIENIPSGKITISTTCLGFERKIYTINQLNRNIDDFTIQLSEDDLTLKEVVVTAQQKKDNGTTSYIIDKKALDHLQATDILDVSTLLPGGTTSKNNNLATLTGNQFTLRSDYREGGSPRFGTAVEVDGVRLSNNSMLSDTKNSNRTYLAQGTETRSLSTTNIESVEVVEGVASVEYGDLSSGIVKINTIKGKTPWTAEFITQPNIKQYALGKGFALGKRNGTLNINLEHLKSTSDLASPYTTYKRSIASVNYNNSLNKEGQSPIILSVGVTGNLGGYDSKNDPDYYRDTYTKSTDNGVRSNFSLKWLLHKPWITNVETSASINYTNKDIEDSNYLSSSTYTVSAHGTSEGYYIASLVDPNSDLYLTPPGQWYEVRHNENKLLTYNAKLKADWSKTFGRITNNLMLGIEFNSSGNKGRGIYYEDVNVRPTWREYKYSDLPFMNTLSYYVEDKVIVPIKKTSLIFTAGVRSDMTFVGKSEYGTVTSFSPRFNMKYDIPFDRKSFVKMLSFRVGIGKAEKLPSFDILYPRTLYSDEEVFSVRDQNEVPYMVYYTQPSTMQYNPDLKWQRDHLQEYGFDVKTKNVNFSFSFFNNKTIDPYRTNSIFTPYSYNLTNAPGDEILIPLADRVYSFDQSTNTVVVSDKSGANPSQTLAYNEKRTFRNASIRGNGSSLTRRGLEWVVDFAQIKALKTSIRIDGRYYYYKGVDETLIATLPTSTNMADGNPYKYIAYYPGTDSRTYNGFKTKKLNTNLTFTTHIPQIRLIVSLRIEASLYNYRQNLSEYEGKQYAFVIDNKDDYFPSETKHDIYAGDQYIGVYPLYYVSYDDMDTKIPFAESFRDAKENNPSLYQELAKMVIRTANYNNMFNKQTISPYFTANFSVTKEIGQYASLTFHAKNFLNTFSKVHSSQTGYDISLYGNSNYVPQYYYGLSLKLKL